MREHGSSSRRSGNKRKQSLVLANAEEKHIKMVLDLMDNNHTRTAEALGISRSTLLRKLKAY